MLTSVKSVYHHVRALPYHGDQVECPCCQGRFRRFLPKGEREFATCPRCGTHERHRLLWLYLQHCTNLFSAPLKVLHFAPEHIYEKRLKALPDLDYVSVDLYNPAMVKADITALPFADNAFDVILCSHVLEHIPDDRRAMSELFRVLKPGGWAMLLVPIELDRPTTFEDPMIIDPKERERLFHQSDHVRLYGRDYVTRLEQAGFRVRQETYVQQFSHEETDYYGLSNEPIFHCTKSPV